MGDYIDVLLQYIGDERLSPASSRYYSCLIREEEACKALTQTLTESQRELFRTYEEARSATSSAFEDDYARAAFLLAREIFR